MFAEITGTGVVTLLKEAASDGIKRHAKCYIGAILVNTGLTSGGMALLTNATKVVKYSKAVHSVCAASWCAAHNIAEVLIIFVDSAIFGEYTPSCGDADYDIYSKTTNVLSDFIE